MGPSQICGCPFREPRVFTIAHIYIYLMGYYSDLMGYLYITIFNILYIHIFICVYMYIL